MGALYAGATGKGQKFSSDDLTLLNSFAGQTALAFSNARLLATLRERNQELSDKVEELNSTLERLRVANACRQQMSRFVPSSVVRSLELDPDSPELEKQESDVTVLFLDIAGYTRLVSRLEEGEAPRLVEKYFSAFVDCIHDGGGEVTEVAGDGLMVIFQDEDKTRHAVAAARTALDIRDETERLNRQLPTGMKHLKVNTGINSGTAFVGVSRFAGRADIRYTFTASGMTTVIAARAGAAALDGEILLSPETAKRVEGAVELESAGRYELKNIDAPMELFRLK